MGLTTGMYSEMDNQTYADATGRRNNPS